MNNQKQEIESIRTTKYHIGSDGRPSKKVQGLLDDLHSSGKLLSEDLYENSTHFIFEIIQNAEDNKYATDVTPTLTFELLENDPTNTSNSDGCLIISNNELGFQNEDVHALCKFGGSTKSKINNPGYIGEKGIGFKSVFLVTDSPHIFSNGYQFRFLREDPITKIGYIVPYWCENIDKYVVKNKEKWTQIILPLKKGKFKEIISELKSFDGETILFLTKLKKLEIIIPDSKLSFTKSSNRSNVKIIKEIDGSISTSDFWLEKKSFNVPASIKEEKRKGVQNREISIAFPLGGVKQMERLFAFLPTESFTGFPFHLNSDFLLTSNRESIKQGNSWNKWLFKKSSEVVVDGIIGMLKEPKIKSHAYRYIPLKKEVTKNNEAFSKVTDEIHLGLQKRHCILSESGGFSKPVDSRILSSNLLELLSGDNPLKDKNITFLHQTALDYEERLKAIQVKRLEKNKNREIFSNSAWLKNKDLKWTARAIKYLLEKFNLEDLETFPLIPLDGGRKLNGSMVFTEPKKKTTNALKLCPPELKAEIYFCDASLYDEIEAHKVDKNSFIEEFGLAEFSIGNFIEKNVLNPFSDEDYALPIENLKKIITFCIESWTVLESENQTDLLKNLPILLDNGEFINLSDWQYRSYSSYGSLQLVTPKSWKPQGGWQHIFPEREMNDDFKILSDFYTDLDRKIVEEYFQLIKVSETPEPENHQLDHSNLDKHYDDQYAEKLHHDFFQNWSTYNSMTVKTIDTFISPIELTKFEKLPDSKQNIFVKWLKKIVEIEISKIGGIENINNSRLFKSMGNYSYYGPKRASFESQIYRELTHSSWVKTNVGYKRPGECFYPTPTLKSLFGNTVPFVDARLGKNLGTFLGVKSEATEGDLKDVLLNMSLSKNPKKKTLLAIYNYLSNNISELDTKFNEIPIIYVLKDGGTWLTADRCVWEDASNAIGDEFGWLGSYYPKELKSFFVDKLGVPESIKTESFAFAWVARQEIEDGGDDIETFLSVAIKRICEAIKIEDNEPWLDVFQQQSLLWSQDKEWVASNDILVNDDPSIHALFKDEFYFVWKPKDAQHSQLKPLYDFLEIERLSEINRYEISSYDGLKKLPKNSILTEETLKLLPYAIGNFSSGSEDLFEKLMTNNELALLFELKEFEVSNLELEVSVKGSKKTILDSYAFVDIEKKRIYKDASSDNLDVKDILAIFIAKMISPRLFRDYLPCVTEILGISDPSRAKKIREKYNWSLTPERKKLWRKLSVLSEVKAEGNEPIDGSSNLDMADIDVGDNSTSPTNTKDMPSTKTSTSPKVQNTEHPPNQGSSKKPGSSERGHGKPRQGNEVPKHSKIPESLGNNTNGNTVSARSSRNSGSAREQDELEISQIKNLKEDQYAHNCQVCLGSTSPSVLQPQGSYVALPENRRRIIEAHHPDMVSNKGSRTAGNLILLCNYHHGHFGDEITRKKIIMGLQKDIDKSVLDFVDSKGNLTQVSGFKVPISTSQLELKCFFTTEHANYWLK